MRFFRKLLFFYDRRHEPHTQNAFVLEGTQDHFLLEGTIGNVFIEE